MQRTNSFRASNPARLLGPLRRRFSGHRGYVPSYPSVPSYWPSRAVRRAIKLGREFRLSAPWKLFLAVNPKVRAAVKAL